jgi:hypothetical protein
MFYKGLAVGIKDLERIARPRLTGVSRAEFLTAIGNRFVQGLSVR